MSTDNELSGGHGDQLMLDELGPQAGETFRNRHTHTIATVVSVATRRKLWVTLRRDGHNAEIPLEWLTEHWEPCRPDGTVR